MEIVEITKLARIWSQIESSNLGGGGVVSVLDRVTIIFSIFPDVLPFPEFNSTDYLHVSFLSISFVIRKNSSIENRLLNRMIN